MAQTWPDRSGAANQFDARGQSWDGSALMSNPNMAQGGNLAFDSKDPTYNSGTGRNFGAQRPVGPVVGAGTRGRSAAPAGGWDDGRLTAAQLGLDAGMGDMFPGGGPEQGMSDRNYGVNGVYQAGGDTGMFGGPSGPQVAPGTRPRQVSPADFNTSRRGMNMNGGYDAQGFYEGSWSQNATNQNYGNQNFGNQGGEVSAPWNQPAMSPRTSPRASQYQYGNGSGPAQGRFAPSRQAAPIGQEFGGPPLYFDR